MKRSACVIDGGLFTSITSGGVRRRDLEAGGLQYRAFQAHTRDLNLVPIAAETARTLESGLACLLAIEETDIKSLLRSGASDEEIAAAVRATVREKWIGHEINSTRFVPPPRPMYAIGG